MDVNDSMSLAELKMLACVQFLGDDNDKYELVFQNKAIGVGDMASTTLLQNNIPNNCVIKLREKQRPRDPSPVKKKPKANQEDILSSAMGSFLQQSSTSTSTSNNPGLSFDFSAIKVQNQTSTSSNSSTSSKTELTDAEKLEHTGLFNLLTSNRAFRAQMEMNMPGAVRAVENKS